MEDHPTRPGKVEVLDPGDELMDVVDEQDRVVGQATRRELAEELGVVGPEPRFLFRHRYRGQENPSWSALFEVTWDGPVRPQASEIAWGAYLSLDELAARLERWPFCPDGLEI